VEGADRTQVLTAEQIMRRPTTTGHPKDSPRTLLRKMERSGFGGLVIMDNSRKVHGYLGLDEAIRQRDAERLDPESVHPLPTATPETNLHDLINLVTEKASPVVVLDPRERLIGIVDKSTLLAALAQGEASGDWAEDSADEQAASEVVA
jgi:glycine betaine/proline transport system ATP-binding protein